MKLINRYSKAALLLMMAAVVGCHGYVDPATLPPQPEPGPTPTPDVQGELTLEASTNSILADGTSAVSFSVFCNESEEPGDDNGPEEVLPVGTMRIFANKTTLAADGTDYVDFTILYGTEEGNVDISEGPTTRLVYTFNGQETKMVMVFTVLAQQLLVAILSRLRLIAVAIVFRRTRLWLLPKIAMLRV